MCRLNHSPVTITKRAHVLVGPVGILAKERRLRKLNKTNTLSESAAISWLILGTYLQVDRYVASSLNTPRIFCSYRE